jgi:hypothetical protein
MSRYIADPQSAAEQGTAARQRIQHWNFNRTVDGFLRAFAATARSTVAGEFARPDVGVEIAP